MSSTVSFLTRKFNFELTTLAIIKSPAETRWQYKSDALRQEYLIFLQHLSAFFFFWLNFFGRDISTLHVYKSCEPNSQKKKNTIRKIHGAQFKNLFFR